MRRRADGVAATGGTRWSCCGHAPLARSPRTRDLQVRCSLHGPLPVHAAVWQIDAQRRATLRLEERRHACSFVIQPARQVPAEEAPRSQLQFTPAAAVEEDAISLQDWNGGGAAINPLFDARDWTVGAVAIDAANVRALDALKLVVRVGGPLRCVLTPASLSVLSGAHVEPAARSCAAPASQGLRMRGHSQGALAWRQPLRWARQACQLRTILWPAGKCCGIMRACACRSVHCALAHALAAQSAGPGPAQPAQGRTHASELGALFRRRHRRPQAPRPMDGVPAGPLFFSAQCSCQAAHLSMRCGSCTCSRRTPLLCTRPGSGTRLVAAKVGSNARQSFALSHLRWC